MICKTCDTNNGVISIQGCMPNRCKTPAQVTSNDIEGADSVNRRRRYHINSTYDDEFVDINTFKKANQWATSTADIDPTRDRTTNNCGYVRKYS